MERKTLTKILMAFFGILFLSMNLFSASIKLKVLDGTNNQPLDDVVVLVVAFTEVDGEPVLEYSRIYKIDYGTNTHFIDGLLHVDPTTNQPITYKIGLIKHKYFPTIREQMENQNIPTVVFDNFESTVSFTGEFTDPNPRPALVMWPAPSDFQAGILNINIPASGVPDTTLFMMDLRHKITDEPVSFGIQLKQGESAGKFWLQIYNVPPAPADTYRLFVMRPDTKEGAEVIVSTAIYNDQMTSIDVELGYISDTRSESETPVDVSNIAFEGVVLTHSSFPIANCSVEIRDTDRAFDPMSQRPWWEINFFRTLTDASGRFVIYSPIRISSYSVQISRIGYKSKYDNPGDMISGTGYYYSGQRVLLPKYFLKEPCNFLKKYK